MLLCATVAAQLDDRDDDFYRGVAEAGENGSALKLASAA